jgi:VWFA-related protein
MRFRLIAAAVLATALFGQDPVQAPPAAPAPAPVQTPPKPPAAEMAQKDEPALFTARVNLVPVPVVVRDRQGHAIGTLKQADFQLFDRGKPQYIARFSVEKAGARMIKPIEIEAADPSLKGLDSKPIEVADGFTALVFDDVHIKFPDLIRSRMAAIKYIQEAAAKKSERFAVFTTSGVTQLDFTDDRDQLEQTLGKIMPRPITGGFNTTCPHMTFYISDRIFNKHDAQVLEAVTQDILACRNLTPDQHDIAQKEAESIASQTVHLGDQETRVTLSVIRQLIRRMAAMPGRRSMIVVSPGFLTLDENNSEKTDILDRAIRASVLINTLDARGLYTVNTDVSQQAANAFTQGVLNQMERESASAESDVLAELAAGTGATHFQNNNDLEEGFRRLSAAPEYYYLLAFSPQNLRMDGGFHSLKVSLRGGTKEFSGMQLTARKGYYAPTHTENAKETERREMEEALFSREEMSDIPVDMHTQFFKTGADSAKLALLIKVDVKKLKFKKVEDRNNDQVTVVCGIFDRNGVYVTGVQKRIDMKLKDETLEKRLDNGIIVRNTLDVKPGVYTVRLVVRDSEGAMMSARNGAVEIPY